MIHETKLLGCRLQMLQTKNARTFSSDHAQLEDLAEHLSSQFPAYAKDLKSWITAGKQGPPPEPKSRYGHPMYEVDMVVERQRQPVPGSLPFVRCRPTAGAGSP